METAAARLYEAMFLIDSAEAARDWDGVVGAINTILKRAGAEIVSVRKWDERPLAYRIGRCLRGTYILVYFRVPGRRIADIERDIQLSERIMRALILRADHLTQEDIDKETPAMRAERGVTEKADTSRGSEPEAAGSAEVASAPDTGAEQKEAREAPDSGTGVTD